MPPYDDRFTPPAPVARVTVRHPDSGASVADVPMLIDSGADATLLPRAVVESLGIAGTGRKFELEAFDGTTSASEVVWLDLSFLGGRFTGQYLVIDAEMGVLGRNILNHVRVLLDGPASTWDES
jgi:Aspartyl protease